MTESTEKAASVDDAEARALKWRSDHLPEEEARTLKRESLGYLFQEMTFSRPYFPKGFFKTDLDARAFLPLRLIDFVRRSDTQWDVIVECTDNQRRAMTTLTRRGNAWVMGFFKAQ